MTISVAMPTYNGATFLREQLESLCQQSQLPNELVVSDDGSTDDTLKIVGEFAETAPFEVRVFRNAANLGYTANFNAAVSLCTGDYICLCDQDDVWFRKKIERSVSELTGDVHVVVNDQLIWDGDKVRGSVLCNVTKLGFPDRWYVTGACTSFSSEFAKLALPFPAEVPYDTWISLLADFLSIRKVIAYPLQYYRRHGRNTTNSVFALGSPTQIDVMLKHGIANPRAGWTAEILRLGQYAGRIALRSQVAERLAGFNGVRIALDKIADEQARYKQRCDLISLKRSRRLPLVLRLWQDGFYDHFAGWKSAIKDMIHSR